LKLGTNDPDFLITDPYDERTGWILRHGKERDPGSQGHAALVKTEGHLERRPRAQGNLTSVGQVNFSHLGNPGRVIHRREKQPDSDPSDRHRETRAPGPPERVSHQARAHAAPPGIACGPEGSERLEGLKGRRILPNGLEAPIRSRVPRIF